ncbi:MAG: DEAD/DEAH box helicase, partial [Prevotella sp.]|nr:DEAD/DEAH box helicase [Prevotella sp.]
MNIEYIEESYRALESDSTLQNLIAQANARYILYNTRESQQNFPRYTIKDGQLNILAFKYLNIGCNYFENRNYTKAAHSLEKGASILEHIHGSVNVETKNKKLFCLISALAYYVCFQYSKSFILISKLQSDTVISSLVSLFLNRKFNQLLNEIDQIITDSSYSDEYLAEHFEENNTTKVYEIIIAKALSYYVQFYHTGNNEFLEIAKRNLLDLQEVAAIKGEPDVWWVIRLLFLIMEGLKESSLWHVLGQYFNTKDEFPLKYIQSLVYKNGSITELFLTQRNSLPKVLNKEQNGSIVSIPTSSGKTRIGEIAILNCLVNEPDAKILFIAPFRSLAYEIENSLDEIFSNLDISVSHLYGGSLFSKLDDKIIDESSVIVATPEKAKALLRSSKEILSCIKLVIVDEGHLLGANKRFIVNEMFYEELRYYVGINGGRFLLLSAVLPNAEDLSEWLTGSSNNVYKENWRPSDEKIGIMEWNGGTVNLNWRSTDTERNSFNPNFIVRQELPMKPRQRKTHYFPADKNQAIAVTAYKLRNFGPVLIFVGAKRSVFTIAREYEKCIQPEDDRFRFKNRVNWKAFKLACIESYGEDSEWLRFAELGIFCHNADLLSDVRLPLERLM